jgi:hypothetical protein
VLQQVRGLFPRESDLDVLRLGDVLDDRREQIAKLSVPRAGKRDVGRELLERSR